MAPADETSGPLPDALRDHGDHVELRTGGSWIVSAVALAVAALGLLVLVLGPGDLGDDPVARVLFGGVLLVAGLATVVLRSRRVHLDAEGVRRTGALGTRRLTWSQVDEVHLQEVWGRPGGVTRRVGGATVTTGVGGGRRSRGSGIVPMRRMLLVRFDGGADRDVALDTTAQLEEGEALVDLLRERAWLPDEVTVASDRLG